MEFTIGDIVKLKAGSPLMTVTGCGKGANGDARVTCTWFDKDQHEQSSSYPTAAVERAAVPSAKRVALPRLGVDRSPSSDGTGWMAR
jgi:uncharacterized protein YodC (DUF2158 family)